MRPVDVAAGIILNSDHQILLAQRPPHKHLAGLWEFPGGKIEDGESAEAALKRELKEELELDVDVVKTLGVYPFSYDTSFIRLHVFVVRALNSPRATHEVQVFRWTYVSDINESLLAPADIQPFHDYSASEACSKR